MSINEIMSGFQVILTAFESPLFLAFTAMIAFSVALGVKRLMLE